MKKSKEGDFLIFKSYRTESYCFAYAKKTIFSLIFVFSFLNHLVLAQVSSEATTQDSKPVSTSIESSASNVEIKKDSVSNSDESSEVKAVDEKEDDGEANTAPTNVGVKDSDALVETADVVSTRLKKMDLAGAAPEIRISVEDIFRSGQTSIADFLRDNPVSAFGSRRERSGLAANAGAATLDLRGLGDSNTLVLLNGVRFPPMSGADSVDINRIPLAIVKEIVVVKDDLSSIYGSDAIGGVVNIITQRGFDGFQVNVGQSWTTLGGGEKLDVNLLAGASSAKSNVTFALGYSKKEKIFSSERDWSKNAQSPIGSPGSYRDVGTGTWYVDPLCDPNDVINAGSQGNFCGFNFAKYTTTLPQVEQFTLFTHIDHKITEFTEFYSEFYFNRTRTNYIYAPAPGFFNIPAAVADTLGLANHTNGNDLEVRYRVTELGNRDTFQENNFFGLTSGIKHEFLDTWSVTLAGSYGQDRNDETGFGNAVTRDLEALIEAGSFNPFAPEGSRGDISSAAYTTSSVQLANFYTADLKFSGELGELFNAPYVLDIGYNHIRRNYDNRVDSLQERGETFTGAGSNGSAEREINSLYAQVNGRLSKSIDVYLSGRYDKFNDFGDTFNPKLGLKYRPTSNLMFRTTVGTGYKAPALSLLYGEASESFETFVDHVACDAEGPGSPSCSPQQYRVIGGGNRNLNEITSFSYSAGFVYEPSNLLMLSIDFWAVNQEGIIVGGTDTTLEEATRAELQGINPADYGFIMNRDVNGFLDPSNPINAPLVNLIDNQSAGLDVAIDYRLGLPIGELAFSNAVSFRLWEKAEPFPGLGMRNDVEIGLVPEWRNAFSTSYKLLDNVFRVSVISTDKYLNAIRSGYIDSYHRFDFSYSYSGFKDTEITLGMINFLATTPPLDPTNPQDQFDEELYSERGPEGYLRVTKYF